MVHTCLVVTGTIVKRCTANAQKVPETNPTTHRTRWSRNNDYGKTTKRILRKILCLTFEMPLKQFPFSFPIEYRTYIILLELATTRISSFWK